MLTRKQKIFFIMSTDAVSGAEIVNFMIIENLKDQYDFYWVSRRGSVNQYLEEKNIKWIEIQQLNVKEIKRVVKQFKPDILHATDYRASVICALANTKVTLIEHLHNNSPWIKKLNLTSIAFLYAGIKADKILTVSEAIREEYIFSKYIEKKIENISNPVSVNSILEKVKSNTGKQYDICCTGRMTEAKNPRRFIEIMEKIKQREDKIKAVWIGTGELFDEIQHLIKERRLEENIELVGFQENPYEIMNKSKIFMLTSKWEGYGLVAFEALTLGLPCVVSNVGGLPEIVDNECGKLCDVDEEFVEEALRLLQDEIYYHEKYKKAIQKAKTLDNIETYMETIKKIYLTLEKRKIQ